MSGSCLRNAFTWGDPSYQVPNRSRLTGRLDALTEDDFLDNYYGFIACRR